MQFFQTTEKKEKDISFDRFYFLGYYLSVSSSGYKAEKTSCLNKS